MADLPLREPPVEEVRRVTESVLADPRFADTQPNWWDALLRWLGDLLDGASLELDTPGNPVAGTAVLVAVIVAVLIGIVMYARSVRRDPARKIAIDAHIGRTSREWLDDAQQHAAAGEWRDALRCHYRALLADLADHGLVEEVPGRTTGEYLDAIRSDVPAAGSAFGDATRQFEAAWYGHVEVGPSDIERFESSASSVGRAAGIRVLARSHR